MTIGPVERWMGRSRRMTLKSIGGLALGAVASSTAAARESDDQTDFTARLAPGNAVSPGYDPASCDADGIATLHLNGDEETLDYDLRLSGIEGVSGVHVHEGSSGENGPHVADVYMGEPTGDAGEFFSLYARGEITPDDLSDEFDGSFAGMVDLLRSENAYLQVHRGEEGNEVVRGVFR